MDLSIIMGFATFVVTFICGIFAKKNEFINNKLIPLQNLLIGIISALIYFLLTKDWNGALAGVGLFTGGVYDLGKNLNKLFTNEDADLITDDFDDMEG